MADRFEKELEELVARHARDLTREITAIILRRLGLGAEMPLAARSANKPRKPAVAPKSRALAPSARAPSKRRRASAAEKKAAEESVARVLAAGGGMSLGEIERASGLLRPVVVNALKALKDQGRVHMGGTRSVARYATLQAAADEASRRAHRAAS